MAAATTEQRELQLVDSVEFRILAVANEEAKLHDLLQRYLAPVILKADSSHAAVRIKVSLSLSLSLSPAINQSDFLRQTDFS